jgi:hypothetical protein
MTYLVKFLHDRIGGEGRSHLSPNKVAAVGIVAMLAAAASLAVMFFVMHPREKSLQDVANKKGVALADAMRDLALSCRDRMDDDVYDSILRNPMIVPVVAKGEANGADCLKKAIKNARRATSTEANNLRR